MALRYRNVRNGNIATVDEPDEAAASVDDEHRGKHLAMHARRTIERMDAATKWERVTGDSDASEAGNRGRTGVAEPLVDRGNNPEGVSQPVVLEQTKGSPDAVPGTTTRGVDGELPSGHLTVDPAAESESADDDGDEPEEHEPDEQGASRPAQSDPKAAWVDWAVADRGVDRSEAESMTKNDLMELE